MNQSRFTLKDNDIINSMDDCPKSITIIFKKVRRAMKTRTLIMVVAVIVACLFSFASGQVPQLMNYQGVLTDSLGNQLNGNYNMTFSIYDTCDGGNALWTQTQNAVSVEQGVFNVLLEIPDSVWYLLAEFEYIPWRYLGVSINAQPEMNPRRLIGSVPYAYLAGADGDWWYPTIPSVMDPIVYLKGDWGIARNSGCSVFGNIATHTNLGVSSTTGTSGQNYGYCTVGGGYHNTASNVYATVGGGFDNTASWSNATVGGGGGNIASLGGATVGGGSANIASGQNATVAGGFTSTASGQFAAVPGGYMNTAAGDYSFSAGNQVIVDANADNTFAFGNQFTTSASHAIIFHDSQTPIKVGIGTTNPSQNLHVDGTVLADFIWRGDSAEVFGLGNTGSNTVPPLAGARRGPVMWFGGNSSVIPGAIELRYGDAGSATPIGYLDIIQDKNNTIHVHVDANGKVGIGTTSPQGALDVSSTTGAFIVPRMTTAQRDALIPVNGMIIYNTTTNQFNFRENGAWVTK